MVYHELESSNLTMMAKLLSSVNHARLRYFKDQKECSMQRVQSGRDCKRKQINHNIDDANRNRKLQDTTNFLKTSADEYVFQAEEKSTISEIKGLISKSNALKCAAIEKQTLLDPCIKKRKMNCNLYQRKDF